MAIVRSSDADQAAALAERLIGAGLQVVEVSMQIPCALQIVKDLVGRHGKAAHVGVGTVLDEATAAHAAQAGAQFIVAPTLNADVVQAARHYGMASFPGCATPTEMQRAIELEATAVKLFPASLWTPRALADILHAMPHLSCVPTGGVRLDEITQWLSAGATAVGLGSSLEQGIEAVLAQVRQARQLTDGDRVTGQPPPP
jgi:2-dehydro-3-deoxyphosphogluconate aldolase/(4S)-4-hydroxy-2-oxoglutarate aldolase